jgi:hypothetical protein
MIIARLFGGLGNQMFQYASAKALALRSNAVLKLDISFLLTPDANNRVYCLQHLNISSPIATKEEVEFFLRNKNFLLKASRYLHNKTGIAWHKRWWHQDYMFQPGFDRRFLKPVKRDIYLDGYWQNENNFNEFRQEIIAELSVITEPGEKNAAVLAFMKTVNAVSLHVRRGDALWAVNQKLYNLPSEDYYRKAVAHIADKINSPVFFVFSDDIEWCKANIKTGYETHFMDFNDDSKNYEDMRLMSACKHHITANSTFSWWGAWLNSSAGKIVVTPEKWFLVKKYNDYPIVPHGWVRIAN